MIEIDAKAAVTAIGAWAAFCVSVVAPPATALGLTNRDAVEQKLAIIEGDSQTDKTVKAGETLELCPHGCVIRLANGESYDFDGGETVILEDTLLILDRAPETSKPAP